MYITEHDVIVQYHMYLHFNSNLRINTLDVGLAQNVNKKVQARLNLDLDDKSNLDR